MVTLFGTSEASGVTGDDERESIVAAVVVDIDGDGEREGRQRLRYRTAGGHDDHLDEKMRQGMCLNKNAPNTTTD